MRYSRGVKLGVSGSPKDAAKTVGNSIISKVWSIPANDMVYRFG